MLEHSILIANDVSPDVMSSSARGGMDISESFRPEDLSKTDFFDFVTAGAPEMGTGNTTGNEPSTGNDQPLQGFDQFWGPDKDTSRLDQNMFDDLNRYVGWNPSATPTSNSISNPPSVNNTDGQIYTITVLNGSTEPWLRKDSMESTAAPSLDIDSILGGFPNYIKQECFNYEDSGFATDSKDNLISPTQPTPPQSNGSQQQVQSSTNSNMLLGNGPNRNTVPGQNSTSGQRHVIAFQNNNNNDWQMGDHNEDQNSAESLLRSALQGKGYSKGMHLPNGVAVLPNVKSEDDLRHVLFSSDHDALVYADSTLAPPIFEEHSIGSPGSQQQSVQSTTTGNVVVDDMFLSLDPFSDDYEKIKRIATEVHQFCTDNNNYSEVVVEPAAINSNNSNSISNNNNSSNQTSSIVSTTTTTSGNSSLTSNQSLIHSTSVSDVTTTNHHHILAPHGHHLQLTTSNNNGTSTIRTKTTKKYKRASNNNNNNTTINNLNNNITNNNNNNNNNNTTSPTHLNGQRKERSLHYCSICSKGFKDKYSVNVHIRTHTGEKPFACSLCGKSFRQKAHLAKHYQTHLAQKNGNGQVKGNKNNNHNNNNNGNSTNTLQSPSQPPPQQQQQQQQSNISHLHPLPPPQSLTPIQIQITHNQTPLGVISSPGQSTIVAIR
uniref:CSON014546 protein n=1 Tax=Culicoides sonorensis TaxID=179676 RepID=A0A336MF83_CULSO